MLLRNVVVCIACVLGGCSIETEELESALTTAPIEQCFDGIDNDQDAAIDEGCAAFATPTQVTAYANTQARVFLNVGKTVAVDGTGIVHRTWLQLTTQATVGDGHGTVMYQRSLDNGTTWTTPSAISIEHDGTGFPKIAAFGADVYVVFHANYGAGPRPYLVRSTDHGQSFFAIQQLSMGAAALPTVAAFGSLAHVVWAAGSTTSGGYAEVWIATSMNDGMTWTTPKQITSNDNHSSWTPSVAAWGPRVVVAWTDERNNIDANGKPFDCQGSTNQAQLCREELYATISNDAGQHFGGELRLTNDGATPHSTWAPLVALWQDYIHIAYFDRLDDKYFQVYYLRSPNGGTSWDVAKRLSPTAIPTDQMMNARPSIGVLDDKLHVAYWQTHGTTGYADIVYTGSPNRGDCWSAPIVISRGTAQEEPHPSLAVSPNGWSFLMWYAKVAGTGGDQLFATKRQPIAPVCAN